MTLAYDVVAAFPSLNETWLWNAAGAAGLSGGLHDALEAFYDLPLTFAALKGDLHFMFLVSTGIAQGCPLSGTIW